MLLVEYFETRGWLAAYTVATVATVVGAMWARSRGYGVGDDTVVRCPQGHVDVIPVHGGS